MVEYSATVKNSSFPQIDMKRSSKHTVGVKMQGIEQGSWYLLTFDKKNGVISTDSDSPIFSKRSTGRIHKK